MPNPIVVVGGIVENEHGYILLVKTKHSGWIFPGGKIVEGEDLMTALIREVKVDCGINIDVSYLIGVYSNSVMHKWHNSVTDSSNKLMFDFMCNPVSGELFASEETLESFWFEKDTVLAMITDPAIRTRFQAYLDFGGSSFYTEFDPWSGEPQGELGL
ncbi:NUDIX hydrolase [Paenibacillus pectinilyticus]|nr:NUDIX hydrolase [Paenibacillus pectinilyticus]